VPRHRAGLVLAFHRHAEHQIILFHEMRELGNGNTGVIKLPAFDAIKHPDGGIWMEKPFRDFGDLFNHRLLCEFFFVTKPLGRICDEVYLEMGLKRGCFLFLNERHLQKEGFYLYIFFF
tara:strand:- start:362 stop:718 length:357 start_codon:yes stop_codon:yes gene_type:complete